MPLVDFFISNDRHHPAIIKPVVETLATRSDYRCRVLSLCEFRGLHSPAQSFARERVEFLKIMPYKWRSSPSSGGGQQTGSTRSHQLRELARGVSWHLLLRRPIAAAYRTRPDLVVLPNDAAFPYDHIVALLRQKRIPFVLVQEGIRFPAPALNAGAGDPYGQGGAAAIAAWGERSAAFFRHQGVPNNQIHLTGSPRFDSIATTDWQTQADTLKTTLKLGERNLLFLSNPIDDLGFCTTAEKLALVKRFITEIASLFDDPLFTLLIKLHVRESVADFEALTTDLPYANRIKVLSDTPLYPLFVLSQAAIVLASTVGLEALLFNLPLAVLEIPGTGFVYDYVKDGAAQGLSWDTPMAPQVETLLSTRLQPNGTVKAYLAGSLATQSEATKQVVGLIRSLVEEKN
jgi:hypothetical protein